MHDNALKKIINMVSILRPETLDIIYDLLLFKLYKQNRLQAIKLTQDYSSSALFIRTKYNFIWCRNVI